MNARRVEFPGHDGSQLAARLDLPPTPPRAYALFAHCFTCSKDVLAASRISAALNEQRIAVLRFDFTGWGMSEGEFANTNFSSNVADLLHAADFLREHHTAPALLIGHSLGGAAVLSAALDGANHLLTNRGDAAYAAGVIAAWMARYLPKLAARVPVTQD